MRSFDIFVDSAANLTDEMVETYNIGVVSYTCSIDGKEMQCYEKGKFLQIAKTFYDAMRAGGETKTTLVNAQKIIDAVSPSMREGRDVLFITISSGISGTYAQAELAAKELKTLFPERKMLVSDSFNASLGEGLFALKAAQLADMGESIEACHKWISDHKLNMHGLCTPASLKYLKRGGRISTTLAIAGTLLNIKPILRGDEHGKLVFWCNERGRKKAISKLVQTFKENVIEPENQTIAITHADCEEDALELANQLKELGAKDIVINVYDLCTGAHAGPGTLALFFLGKERGKTASEAREESKFAAAKKSKSHAEN